MTMSRMSNNAWHLSCFLSVTIRGTVRTGIMQRQLFYKRAAGFFFGVVAMVAGSAIALQIDYGTTTGSAISFNGSGGFSFNPGVGSFRVTSGNAAGLLGDISGTFNIGSITTSGGVSSAPVSGSSQFVIHDAANNSLTGTL